MKIIFQINVAICIPTNLLSPLSLLSNSYVILIWKSKNCAVNENAKQINILWTKRLMEEKMIIILKGSIKQTVIKQSPTFPSFSIVIDCCVSVFSLSLYKIKRFVKSKRLKRFRLKHLFYLELKKFENIDWNISSEILVSNFIFAF